jgi:hypothetical protein
VKLVDFYGAVWMHSINFTYSKPSTVHVLDTFRYEVLDDVYLSSVSSPNNAKYRVDTDGYLQITSFTGLPVGVGKPNLGLMPPSYLNLLTGLPTYDSESDTMRLDYEPILGIPVSGMADSVVHMGLDTSFLNSGMYDGLFSSSDTIYMPNVLGVLYLGVTASAAEVLAAVLYGLPAMGDTLMLVFVIIGCILLLIMVGLCVKSQTGAAISPK